MNRSLYNIKEWKHTSNDTFADGTPLGLVLGVIDVALLLTVLPVLAVGCAAHDCHWTISTIIEYNMIRVNIRRAWQLHRYSFPEYCCLSLIAYCCLQWQNLVWRALGAQPWPRCRMLSVEKLTGEIIILIITSHTNIIAYLGARWFHWYSHIAPLLGRKDSL